jgi:hypothetical protein
MSRPWFFVSGKLGEGGRNGRRTCNISVPTACIISIQPLVLANASSLSREPGARPSKLEKGCSIIIERLCFLHNSLTWVPAEQREG